MDVGEGVNQSAPSGNDANSYATLDLELLEVQAPRVAVTPGPTLFTLAADVAGAGRGTPAEWIAAARAQLEPSDHAILAPTGGPPGSFSPGCLIQPDDQVSSDSVREELERIATLSTDALLDDIAFACGSSPAPPWDEVARRPRRWLVLYARALGRVWHGMQEPWAASRGLIELEIERVETAAARGALPELSADFHHRAEVRDGLWRMAHDEPLELQLPAEGLVITPVLNGPGSARANVHDDGTLSAIHYPLPGATKVLNGEVLPSPAALDALLGAQRAKILRLLDRPRHAGAIAQAIVATPGAATHHLRALEVAGLIIRERDGRHVVVHRSVRGSALLGLYAD